MIVVLVSAIAFFRSQSQFNCFYSVLLGEKGEGVGVGVIVFLNFTNCLLLADVRKVRRLWYCWPAFLCDLLFSRFWINKARFARILTKCDNSFDPSCNQFICSHVFIIGFALLFSECLAGYITL